MSSERYQRREKLGEGQMSIVWLALDSYTQDLVALKMMTAITEDDRRHQKARERFHREIEIARDLQHPHILSILDYGYINYEGRRVPYLTMPYVPDRSLVELIKQSPPWQTWSLLQIADGIVQAADSLWYLHSRQPQIVHGDIKPGNFLCRLERRPERMVYLYLCDFGISRQKQKLPDMSSELLGTFPYMAPEQFDREVNTASDQYALAIMACYLLTGKLPIQAATHEEYPDAHKHDSPLPPSVLNPQRVHSREIDAVIARALEKQPAKRYPSVQAFARALHRAITEHVREQASAPTEQSQEDITLLETLPYHEPLAKIEPVVHSQKVSADFSLVLDPPETTEDHILDEALPAKPLRITRPPTKNDAALFMPLRLREPVRLYLPGRPKSLCWSPRATGLACCLYGQAPIEVRGDGSVHEVLVPQAPRSNGITWSPDGQTLAVAVPGTIHFWDVTAQAVLPLELPYRVRTIDAFDWSVDEYLAVWIADQILIYSLTHNSLTSLRSLTPQRITTGGMYSGGPDTLCWSPDGAWLAAGATNGELRCWSAIDPLTTWQVTEPGQKVCALAWSPDASLLVAAFRDKRVVGWDVATQHELFHWRDLPAMPRALSISTQGYILFASSERRLFVGRPAEAYPAHILPGQLLVACSPRLPEVATLDEQREHVLTIWRE